MKTTLLRSKVQGQYPVSLSKVVMTTIMTKGKDSTHPRMTKYFNDFVENMNRWPGTAMNPT
jgi:hypothetical protein